jgi:hypothetical protein
MFSSKNIVFALYLALSVTGADANSQELVHGGVVPLHKISSEQWIEKVAGDMDKPGQPFVIRIHHDAGYVVFPHTHPEDENITVITGSWALGMGPRIKMSELEPMEQGALGFVPKKMAHFGYAKVETILQVHGIGPFVNQPIDPVYELTAKGVLSKPSLLKPGVPTSSSPPDCFKLRIGARMQGEKGEGIVVGALCSPANQFTQYWIQKANGERFWATLQDLKPSDSAATAIPTSRQPSDRRSAAGSPLPSPL